MGIESLSARAQAFYVPFVVDSPLSVDAPVTYWTGVATSPYLDCEDFVRNAMPYNLGDSRADEVSGSCSILLGRENAYGLYWDGVSRDEERLFLKTIFYSAFDDAMKLVSACSQPTESKSIFASPYEISTSPSQNIVLQEPGTGIETFRDLSGKIASSEVCMASSGDEFVFFWNSAKIEERLADAQARAAAEWSFNWANYECGS